MSGSASPSQLRDAPGHRRTAQAVARQPFAPVACARDQRSFVFAALSGRLDSARAPAVREQLLHLLRPAANQLVLDLTLLSDIDASGLAVLVGTERRARLLGGSLRLAAASPAVRMAVRTAGLDWLLHSFPTVQAAVSRTGRESEGADTRAYGE